MSVLDEQIVIDILLYYCSFVKAPNQCFPQVFPPKNKKPLKNVGILLSY